MNPESENAPTEPCETDQEVNEESNPSGETESHDSALLLQTTQLPELALNVQEIQTESLETPLFQFESLEGASTSQVCLAEDGLPYLTDPIECHEEECFVLEIPMKSADVAAWHEESNPTEMCQVAAASRRARPEVHVKTLTAAEKQLFDVAKDNELSCWLSTNSLKPILRQKLNPDQILKSRWVLTWKDVEAEDDKPAFKKAKARLVVLGYMDPMITSVARDSPTLSKEGRATVLQCIASYQWELTSFDIKTAFLRGKADQANPLAMEPPAELRKKLKLSLSDKEVCALVGNAYGRVGAPLLFYKELSRHLHKLEFKTHPLGPCVFILESGVGDSRTLHGVIGTHACMWR